MRKTAITFSLLLLVVGSFLAGAWYSRRATPANPAPAARPVLYDVEPTHPNSSSDHSGVAPDDRMQHEPVDTDAGQSAHARPLPSTPAGTVRVSPEQQQLIGVRLGQVEKRAWTHTLRALGRVAVDETRVYRLTTATDGWIRQVFANSTGSLVRKNETLVSFYSPDSVAFQQAYLYALAALERLSASGATASPEQLALTQANVQSAKDRLTALGMSAAQIEEIGRSHQFAQQVLLRAPDTSFVLARNVSPGQRFDRGTELYRLADLSQVWILADLFEGEAAYFRPGVLAQVSLPPQRKVLYARVSPVLPQFDATTRSLKIRLNADNPGFVLRPDMFVDVDLPVTLAPTIAVPVEAVLDSGLARTVFVEHRPGVFEPRQVETGWRFGDHVEIVRGLTPGERIVTSGTFLIDSEARMKLGSPAAPTPSPAGPAPSSAGQALAPAPPPHHHGAPAMPAHAQGGAQHRHD